MNIAGSQHRVIEGVTVAQHSPFRMLRDVYPGAERAGRLGLGVLLELFSRLKIGGLYMNRVRKIQPGTFVGLIVMKFIL